MAIAGLNLNLLELTQRRSDLENEISYFFEKPVVDPEQLKPLSMDEVHQMAAEYAKMYSAGELVDTKAEQGEPDPEEEADGEDEEEKDERTASNIFKEIKKNYGRAPRIVKEEDVDDEHEGWDISSLFLYSNGVVTDEDDNVIDGEELETMVGDCLTKYDFVHSNEKIIYVQCFKLNTFYEINKFNKPFDS